jgi:hypothetical protein
MSTKRNTIRRIDDQAVPVAWRLVISATVTHVIAAKYRGATFSGTLELTHDSLGVENGRVYCRASWYGMRPKKDAARIRVKEGGWRLEDDYSGPVIADLGRR